MSQNRTDSWKQFNVNETNGKKKEVFKKGEMLCKIEEPEVKWALISYFEYDSKKKSAAGSQKMREGCV